MYHPLSLFVGLRYTRSRRRNHFISFISLISTLGIALGVVVLITVLSVMNGFHKEVRERILGMASHGDVQAIDGRMRDWQEAMRLAREHPRVLGAAPYIEGQAMLSHRREVTGAIVRCEPIGDGRCDLAVYFTEIAADTRVELSRFIRGAPPAP